MVLFLFFFSEATQLLWHSNKALASGCDVIGAISHSCRVTQMIRMVQDQQESFRRSATVETVEHQIHNSIFFIIPQPQFHDAWYYYVTLAAC